MSVESQNLDKSVVKEQNIVKDLRTDLDAKNATVSQKEKVYQ
jgi:hypothetical protein